MLRPSSSSALVAAVLLALVAHLAPAVHAQDARTDAGASGAGANGSVANGVPASAATQEVTLLDRLAELRAAVTAERERLEVTPDAPVRARELVTEASASLDAAQVALDGAAEFRRLTESAASRLVALDEELGRPPDTTPPALPDEPVLTDLEQRASRADAELVAARARLAELIDESGLRQARSEAIPGELARLVESIADLEQELAVVAATNGDASDRVATARSLALSARLVATRASRDSLEAEAASYDARVELLPKRRAKAQREVARAELVASTWTDAASSLRRRQAEATASQARADVQGAADASPTLGAIAERNAELAARRGGEEGLTARLAAAERATDELRARAVEVAARSAKAEARVDLGGVSLGVGDLLRRDAQWLPSSVSLRRESEERRRRMSEWQLELFSLEDELESVGDLGTRRQSVLDELASELGPDRAAELAGDVDALLRTQEQLLTQSIDDLSRLIAESSEQVAVHRVLRANAAEYRRFIDERILWYPSDSAASWVDGDAYADALVWLVSPTTWGEFAGSIVRGGEGRPERAVLAFLLLVAWLLTARRLRAAIASAGAASRSFRTDGHALTVRAAAAYLGVVVPVPAALSLVAGFAASDWRASTQTLAIGRAIDGMLLSLFALIALREAARVGGIGETIFRWRPQRLRAVRKWVLRLGPPQVALAAVATAFGAAGPDGWSGGPGRVAFLLSQLVLFAALRRAFRDVGAWELERRDGVGVSTLAVRRLWIWLALLTPLLLAGVSAAGYGYAAVQLGSYYRLSLVLGLVVVLANAIALRWLFVARRRLAVERAQARLQAKREADKDGEVARDFVALEEEDIDLPAVDAQTRQFIRSLLAVATVLGLYGIWSAGLPAIAVFDQVEVWPRFGHVESSEDAVAVDVAPLGDAAATDAGGAANGSSNGSSSGGFAPGLPIPNPAPGDGGAASEGSSIAVSLADLLLALLVVLVTIVGTKNVPGLLEITLLKRLPLDSGARTAIATLVRYLILIFGASIAFTTLGIGWEKVQWLAAALTFGLAFGLQEVFANFVSGIIILLERPIRVGDIVTVGGVEGRVTRLRIRATTIMDWDRKELLVPNKEFITSSIINWSLSDPITRVVIPVGVAYGSDIELVHEQLRAVANANELVLTDPGPQVVFRSFGGSSLDFELRVFIASRDAWPELVDRLHSEIDAAFRVHDIEIAFPQLDLHLRDAVETRVRVTSRDGTGEGD